MTSKEKSKLLIEFKSMHEAAMAKQKAAEAEHESDRKMIESLLERLDKLVQNQASSADFKTLFESEQKRNAELLKRIDSLEALLKVRNANIFGSKSQKSKTSKVKDTGRDHQKDKDDFDGTPGSINQDTSSEESGKPVQEQSAGKADRMEKEMRLYRRMEYRTMTADKSVSHRSDKSRLPEGAEIIKVFINTPTNRSVK